MSSRSTTTSRTPPRRPARSAEAQEPEIKILWHSNAPWANTGYGVQSALFARRFRDAGHDVAFSAFYGLEGGIMQWEGMTCYPTDVTRLGKQMLPSYVKHHAAGDPVSDVLVLTLMDAWTLTDMRYGGVVESDGLSMASWVPVDHDPAPPGVVSSLKRVGTRPIAMSRFGEDRLRRAGLDPLYVPHGVDTAAYRPMPEQRAQLRAALGATEDTFIVGMVANNQGNGPPRKAFPQLFEAFARFAEVHPDSMLYLHTEPSGIFDGINLFTLAEAVGMPEGKIAIVDQFRYAVGEISPEQMAATYSMLDVLAMPSYGEGFGVPLIEAQACGTPVIATNWTAMPELVGAGWLVEGDAWYNSAHLSYFMCPAIGEIYDALGHAHAARGDESIAEAAREFALGYDADAVMRDYWTPALAELEPNPQVKPESRQVKRARERKAEAVTA